MSKFKALKEIIKGVAPTIAKEGEEAAASALAKEAEEAVAKESSEYMVPGPWQSGSYGRVTEELPIEFLQSYKGNRLRNNDLSSLKKSIQEEGLREPLILGFDPSNNKIKLVEGNHRLEALRQLGYTHAPVRGSRSHIDDVLERLLGHPHADYPKLPFKPSTDRIDPSYYPADMKPSDIIDFEALKKIKPKAIAGAGILGGAAFSPESAEASEIREKPKSQLKDLLKDYSPSFGSKTGDYSSYDESEALPTEGMQGQGLATIIRNIVADKKPKGEFEEGGGGIEESAISPIDLVTPGMVAAPAKALGRGALTAGKAGLEAVESGAQALAKRYPELAARLMDNRGSLELPISFYKKLAEQAEPASIKDAGHISREIIESFKNPKKVDSIKRYGQSVFGDDVTYFDKHGQFVFPEMLDMHFYGGDKIHLADLDFNKLLTISPEFLKNLPPEQAQKFIKELLKTNKQNSPAAHALRNLGVEGIEVKGFDDLLKKYYKSVSGKAPEDKVLAELKNQTDLIFREKKAGKISKDEFEAAFEKIKNLQHEREMEIFKKDVNLPIDQFSRRNIERSRGVSTFALENPYGAYQGQVVNFFPHQNVSNLRYMGSKKDMPSSEFEKILEMIRKR